MDEKLKIKISIADECTLTVDFSGRRLRSASKKIDKMIKQFEENYNETSKISVLCNLHHKQNKKTN
jgi:cell division protein ZapA